MEKKLTEAQSSSNLSSGGGTLKVSSKKKEEDLSDEQLKLKNLELFVKEVQVHNPDLQKAALKSMRREIQASTSPTPLKFLLSHYGTLKAFHDNMADSDLKKDLSYMLSVLDFNLTPRAERIIISKIYALWDFESLKLPRHYLVNAFLPILIKLCRYLGFSGTFEMEAIVGKFTPDRITPQQKMDLEDAGIKVYAVLPPSEDCPEGVADEEIKKRMDSWAAQSREGVVILLTNDGGYAEHMTQVVEEGHKTLLICLKTRIHKRIEFYQDPRFDLGYVLGQRWIPKDTTEDSPDAATSEPRLRGSPVKPDEPAIVWA